jgi:hydroxymethylpyrimidine pyrophosphatase-like HAD family hydrolase
VKFALSCHCGADLVAADGGKGNGIRKILEYYHLDPSQAMAFGDNHNDMEMLQTVGTGVAMGNATQQLKDIADDVCGDVDQDGIYRYCVARGLI